jgi:hypothetical protein
MSELSDNLADLVQDRAAGTTDTVLNLRTGARFSAEIEGNLDPFTLPEGIARDPRAKFRIYVTDDDEAAGINETDKVQFKRGGKTIMARILQRDSDPASPQTKLLAIHLVDGKDL